MRTIILVSVALAAVGCDRRADDRENRRAVPGANVDREKRAAEERHKEEARPAADNTKTNVRDRDMDALTPGDQGESDADRSITVAVRRAVVADDDLTVTAKNVKIITRDGVVTLRGPVRSDAERAVIEGHARAAVGVKQIDNQLEVAPSR
jgi:hyperosmotically inducible periplasmic protein